MTLEPLLGLLGPRDARDNAALGMTRLGGERVVVGAAVRKRGSWREGGRYGPLERHGVVERECEALERDCEGGGLCVGGGQDGPASACGRLEEKESALDATGCCPD